MSRPAIFTERIKGCYFRKANIRIKRFDAINYVVSPQFDHSGRLGWDGPTIGLTLSIPQIGVQSPRLTAGGSYLVEFRASGVFTVQFLEDPTIKQLVVVEDGSVFPDTESDSRESASIDSNIYPRGLFHPCQHVSWKKRPRSKMSQKVEKKFAKKKDTSSESQQSGQKRSQKSPQSSPGQKEELTQKQTPAPQILSSPPGDIREQSSLNLENSPQIFEFGEAGLQGVKIVSDQILEEYRLTGLDSEAVGRIFLKLKLKYETSDGRQSPGVSLDALVQSLVQTLDLTGAEGSLEVVVPKGHCNRRLRRARQRFENRFNVLEP